MSAAPFIALSLVLLAVVGLLGLFMASRESRSANRDDPPK